MMPILNIITPVTRPDNLWRIYPTLPRRWFDVRWYCVIDKAHCPASIKLRIEPDIIYLCANNAKSVFGNSQRNSALDAICRGWVFFLDDDTIMHPDFGPELYDLKDDVSGVVFPQYRSGGRVVAPFTPEVNMIDTGQMMVRREMIGEARWNLEHPSADGMFLSGLFKSCPGKFLIVSQPLSLYNWLRES